MNFTIRKVFKTNIEKIIDMEIVKKYFICRFYNTKRISLGRKVAERQP